MNGINIAGLVFGSKWVQYFQFSDDTFLLLTHFSCPKNAIVSGATMTIVANAMRIFLTSSLFSST